LLDTGSANGMTLELLSRLGVDAWGVENSPYIHARTPAEWQHRNILGDVRALPFEDSSFDFIYDTCLCHVPPEDLDRAIAEMFRVVRTGVLFSAVTSDMSEEMIARHELFFGLRTISSTWEWTERFFKQGFRMAVVNPKTVDKIWRIECESNEGELWYPDKESFRACFFSKPQTGLTVLKPRPFAAKPAARVRRAGVNATG
jgi:SAM-dependent methyltransferase